MHRVSCKPRRWEAAEARAVRAYGRVLEPAPLLALASDRATDRAALAASSKEYQRLNTLFDQGQNASAKAMESAQATMQHDQIVLQTAEAQLVAAWGRPVAEEPDLAAFLGVPCQTRMRPGSTRFAGRRFVVRSPGERAVGAAGGQMLRSKRVTWAGLLRLILRCKGRGFCS